MSQIFVKSDQFDIVDSVEREFVKESKNLGPIVEYTHHTSRSYIDSEGREWWGLYEDWNSAEREDAVVPIQDTRRREKSMAEIL